MSRYYPRIFLRITTKIYQDSQDALIDITS
jgi:hypothetical protein